MVRALLFVDKKYGIGLGHVSRGKALQYQLEILKIKAIIIDSSLFNEKYISRMIETRQWSGELIVIDSYNLKTEDYILASNTSKNCIFFDDTLRINYPKGIIVNPAISAQQDNYEKMYTSHTICVGKDYMLLQKEFLINLQSNLDNIKHINDKIDRILINLGGDDVLNLNKFLINIIKDYDSNIKIYCISKDASIESGIFNLTPKQMSDLMLSVDLCISGCGQSLIETISSATPCIALEISQNQRDNLEGFKKCVLPIYELWSLNRNLIKTELLKNLSKLQDKQTRHSMISNGLNLLRNSTKWNELLMKIFN